MTQNITIPEKRPRLVTVDIMQRLQLYLLASSNSNENPMREQYTFDIHNTSQQQASIYVFSLYQPIKKLL